MFRVILIKDQIEMTTSAFYIFLVEEKERKCHPLICSV